MRKVRPPRDSFHRDLDETSKRPYGERRFYSERGVPYYTPEEYERRRERILRTPLP